MGVINLQPLVATLAVIIVVMIVSGLLGRWLTHLVHRLMARRSHELDREAMLLRWQKVEEMLSRSDNQFNLLALIEADNLLDMVLKAMHMPGETFALRIKFAERKFYELKRVRRAHRLRNKAVHEPGLRLSPREVRTAIREYHRALRLLGAI